MKGSWLQPASFSASLPCSTKGSKCSGIIFYSLFVSFSNLYYALYQKIPRSFISIAFVAFDLQLATSWCHCFKNYNVYVFQKTISKLFNPGWKYRHGLPRASVKYNPWTKFQPFAQLYLQKLSFFRKICLLLLRQVSFNNNRQTLTLSTVFTCRHCIYGTIKAREN